MAIRNMQNILPTPDADFLSQVLDFFNNSDDVVEVDEGILDKSALIQQIRGKLYKKGISYSIPELIMLDAALSSYLSSVSDEQGKIDVARRLKRSIEATLEKFIDFLP